MKKPVRIVLLIAAGIALLLVGIVSFFGIAGIPSFENQAPELQVEITEERVSEGARIATVLCMQCHGSTDGQLGGSFMHDAADFGEIYASNISQHPELGIADYTAGELAYLLRTGIKKDGQFVPFMPLFPNLSDEDLYSIIAFLQSDHPLAAPSDISQPESKPNLLAKVLSRTAFKPLPYPEEAITAPPPGNRVAFGRYLTVAKFDCYACHSASFQTNDIMQPEKSEGFLGGGNRLYDKEMNVVLSTNLTMDEETGLGTWTEEGFIKALRYGMKPDGSVLQFPMLPAPMITEEEASAIWAYLQTVPVIHNPAE